MTINRYYEAAVAEGKVDSVVRQYATVGDLPPATGYDDNVVAYVIATSAFYRVSGNSWTRSESGALDVQWYGAVGDWDGATGTDNTSAFNDAIAAALTVAAGSALRRPEIYVPPGRYAFTAGTSLTTITLPIGIRGAGPRQTIFVMAGAFPDWFMTVDDCWYNEGASDSTENGFPDFNDGDTVNYDTENSGVRLEGFAIEGDRSLSQAGGLRFTNRNDFVTMRDVHAHYIPGTAFALADTSVSLSIMRECQFYNIVQRNCGTASAPAILIGSNEDSADGSNNLEFYNLRSMYPFGVGIQVEHDNPSGADFNSRLRRVRVFGMWIHGSPDRRASYTDALMVFKGRIDDVRVYGARFNTTDNYCVSVQASTNVDSGFGGRTRYPRFLHMDLTVESAEYGLDIQTGSGLKFDVAYASIGTEHVTVGNDLQGDCAILGAQPTWVWNIDSARTNRVNAVWAETNEAPLRTERLAFGTGTTSPYISYVDGDPEGVVDAPQGTILIDENAAGVFTEGQVWIKQTVSGSNTGWRAIRATLGGGVANRPSAATAPDYSFYVQESGPRYLYFSAGGNWYRVQDIRTGATGSRPGTLGSGDVGVMFFDETLGQPIWWDGTGWVDATGTTA